MNIMTKLTAAAALVIGIGSASQVHAANVNYWVANNTQNALWITVYGNGFEGDKREAFCVLPGHQNVNYINMNEYANVYIRAEVKKSANSCSVSSNIHDLSPVILTLSGTGRAQMTYASSKAGETPSVNNTGYH